MDGYAPGYIGHNVPFLVVSGLGTDNEIEKLATGTRISSEIAPVESEDATTLLKYFRDRDASDLPWNSREHTGRNKFSIKTIGRDFVLPLRSAQLPTSAIPSSPISKPVLHSVLSPLSPGSPLYPDGLLDSAWVEKHQNRVPSAYICFYTFTSDPTLSTLQDNKLKTDINNIKSTINQSGFKTRLVVALLSEKSIVQSPDVEDRLANIRKATGLDAKTSLFFLPPQSSVVELKAFVESIISTIYPICIEYYRDLSKHSRRKRNRGIIPPPTAPPTSGTSQTLSSQGWNVRYDFKLGVFAEFRQEMDAAVRSYESGYEGLLGTDVLEAIASWNPRWNEARMLADIFAIRILRCLLWNGNSTAAVRRWSLHRERIRDFVDRRGKGSLTYGWEAWEARWTTVMAEMIKKASITELKGSSIYLLAEKSLVTGERMQPWEYLHHPGYWYRAAAKHQMARRVFAKDIPVEARSPPSVSSASQPLNKAFTYDTYMCPEPHEESPLPGHTGVDHSQLILESLGSAITEYEKRKQFRQAQELQLISANESMSKEAWSDAVKVLRQLWQKMSFRKEGWWDAAEEVCWLLRQAATRAGDAGYVATISCRFAPGAGAVAHSRSIHKCSNTLLAVDWELMNGCFTHYPKWHYDLSKSLNGIDDVQNKPAVVLNDQQIHSFLTATYTFEFAEGKVGELCPSQLAVVSSARSAAVPITMSEIHIAFDGSMKSIVLKHLDDSSPSISGPSGVSFQQVDLREVTENARPSLVGKASLIFQPGQTSVFDFGSLLREAGEASAVSATFNVASDMFDFEYVHTFGGKSSPDIWWGAKAMKKRIVRDSPYSIRILPKPPKVELKFVNLVDQYYTNEEITLQLEVTNGEDVDSIINLDVHLLGEESPAVVIQIDSPSTTFGADQQKDTANLTSLGKITAGASTVVKVIISPSNIPLVCDLVTKATYSLVSDLETPVYKSVSKQIELTNPFEANYDFSPRVHPDPWPTLFTHVEGDSDLDEQEIIPQGLAQKWCLAARFASFATEDLIVEDVGVEVLGVLGGIQCHTKKLTVLPASGLRVAPKSIEEALFDTFTQKISLDDRGTATLDVALKIQWHRDFEGAPVNTTVLAVPRLLVSSSEPRVLAAVSYSTKIPSMIHFDVTIENPSNHFLTFGVSMEPSEKFAFSGVKQSTLQLVPLSRRTVRFRLLPSVRGEWIGPIQCVIRDRYFQKVLKVAPTEGMKLDKEGILIWSPIPPEEDA